MSDEEAPQGSGGGVGGDGGDIGVSDAGKVGGSHAPSSSGAVPLRSRCILPL